MRNVAHEAEVCVVGGGMAGLCAAVAAARHGASVVLMQDRPVLGGNASSECRVHIQGADRHNSIPNLRETGLLEEVRLENLARNPHRNFSVWDTVLYETARLQDGLTLLLNCSCHAAQVEAGLVRSVTGWQMTTETVHTVEAAVFMDCSGDGILAPLTGAEYRVGREGRGEYGESHAPEEADSNTMGMSLLFMAREHDSPQPFKALPWAHTFERCDVMPGSTRGHSYFRMGYWWIERGGDRDSIHDADELRHELLRIVYGVWDHIKNHCPNREAAENWALEWVQFLPAKREGRRYLGDHVMTQNDVEAGGRFDDLVAYGGWSMDDHHPAGFWCRRHGAPATVFHPAPSPYGIPYRSLCSRSVSNLMVAGRCASATHMAMSSMRVMGTGCSMGQAAGTAAAMAARAGMPPREVGSGIDELQQALLRDDAYLPGIAQAFSALTTEARLTASQGDPEPLRDGTNRPVGEQLHAWVARPGDVAAYEVAEPREVREATLILDSALDSNIIMSYHHPREELKAPPPEMPKAFRMEAKVDGRWRTLHEVRGNHQRLVRLPVGRAVEGVRFVLDATYGADASRTFAFYVD